MTWQTTLQKKGNLNADASAVGRSYALLKRKAQNPLTLSPLGMALAACGEDGTDIQSDTDTEQKFIAYRDYIMRKSQSYRNHIYVLALQRIILLKKGIISSYKHIYS